MGNERIIELPAQERTEGGAEADTIMFRPAPAPALESHSAVTNWKVYQTDEGKVKLYSKTRRRKQRKKGLRGKENIEHGQGRQECNENVSNGERSGRYGGSKQRQHWRKERAKEGQRRKQVASNAKETKRIDKETRRTAGCDNRKHKGE